MHDRCHCRPCSNSLNHIADRYCHCSKRFSKLFFKRTTWLEISYCRCKSPKDSRCCSGWIVLFSVGRHVFNFFVESHQKSIKNDIPSLKLSITGIVWRKSRQVCLLSYWVKHLIWYFYFYVANRWWGRAVYPLWSPSLKKDTQTEHKLIRINE